MSDDMNISDMLTDQLNRLFDNTVDHKLLSQAKEGPIPQELWAELENIGVTLAVASEDAGGSQLSWAEIEGVWRMSGYHAAPVPLGETIIANWALGDAGLEIPGGPLAVCDQLLQLNDSGQVSGSDIVVPWADRTDHLVALADNNGQRQLCLLGRDSFETAPAASISAIPCAHLTLNNVTPVALAPASAAYGPLGLLPYVAALRATQIGGTLERVLALCVEYGNTRVQFGRALGKFQAIQHMIASLAEQSAAARMAGSMACRGLDKDDDDYGVAVAKIQTGHSASAATAIAHQSFGAIGVTEEHMLQFYTRSLWQWRDEAGSEHWWSEWLGSRTIHAGGAAIWDTLVKW